MNGLQASDQNFVEEYGMKTFLRDWPFFYQTSTTKHFGNQKRKHAGSKLSKEHITMFVHVNTADTEERHSDW